MYTNSSTPTPQQRIDILNYHFSIITRLMNTKQTILLSGGGVILRIGSDSQYYEKIKAFLSDMGCDIAAERLMAFEQLNNSGSISGSASPCGR